MTTSLLLTFLIPALTVLALLYHGKGFIAFVVLALCELYAWYALDILSVGMFNLFVLIYFSIIALFAMPSLRAKFVSKPVMGIMAKAMPTIGETEDIALKAGSVWWEGELFGGKPKWSKLLNFKVQPLTQEEQDFLDGPVEKFCQMINDDDVSQNRDMPVKAWNFIKKNKLFGMVIPKEYGGLGFSAAAHSAVVTKISSRSVAAAVTVMVPNSLGPGELLVHYGTEEQKKHYLKNLACGKEIPCFALTEPHAGSDAANGRSVGTVCKGTWKGKKVTGIKLTFDKRYITLAPVATVVGLAFRLEDPDHILGDTTDIGITCALIPHDTPGLEIGNRHDPMGVPFPNGPVRGKDMFVPLDFVIGGEEGVGTGWRMLMEALSTGRCISLPSLSVGAAQLSTRAIATYSTVREQFGLPIGKFEGVRERMARVAGHSYLMTAMSKLACGAVDAGESPSVTSAIAKAYLTEGMRMCVNDGMDILAGSAISRGPRNILSRPYTSIPVGITVEGANILTRSLIVFGQGAMRCHPFVLKEVTAIAENDLAAFDKAFFGHINHVARNATRSFVFAITGNIFIAPPVRGKDAHHYKDLEKLSNNFALLSDFTLATLGGGLKKAEYLSGRFADALSWIYLATATLKDFDEKGSPQSERALVEWVMAHSKYEAESALLGVLQNLPNRPMAGIGKVLTFPFGGKYKKPSDKQIEAVCNSLLDPETGIREMLSDRIFIPDAKDPALGLLEAAFDSTIATAEIRAKIAKGRRSGALAKSSLEHMANEAKEKKLITAKELKDIMAAEKLRDAAVQVNDFSPEDYKDLK